MATYTCPICYQGIPRDLIASLDHSNEHILEEIRKRYPEKLEEEEMLEQYLELQSWHRGR